MELFPLLREGKRVGDLSVERDGLYLCVSAQARLPENLWCIWLLGEQGEIRLGVPEPKNGTHTLCRRISARSAAPLGKLLRGEARLLRRQTEGWEQIQDPGRMFCPSSIRREAERCSGGLTRQEGTVRCLALPYGAKQPFPMVSLFCFARIYRINGREYAVFSFDGRGQPLFLPENG